MRVRLVTVLLKAVRVRCNHHKRWPDRGSQVLVHRCTLDEIRGWKKMTDHRRHQVIDDRVLRQSKLQRESPEPYGGLQLWMTEFAYWVGFARPTGGPSWRFATCQWRKLLDDCAGLATLA